MCEINYVRLGKVFTHLGTLLLNKTKILYL